MEKLNEQVRQAVAEQYARTSAAGGTEPYPTIYTELGKCFREINKAVIASGNFENLRNPNNRKSIDSLCRDSKFRVNVVPRPRQGCWVSNSKNYKVNGAGVFTDYNEVPVGSDEIVCIVSGFPQKDGSFMPIEDGNVYRLKHRINVPSFSPDFLLIDNLNFRETLDSLKSGNYVGFVRELLINLDNYVGMIKSSSDIRIGSA